MMLATPEGRPHSACPLSGTFAIAIKQSDFSLAVKPDLPDQQSEADCSLAYRCSAVGQYSGMQ